MRKTIKKKNNKAKTKEKVTSEENREIGVVTTNDNGIYYIDPSIKKKNKNVLAYENCELYHHGIGATISTDISPKFQDWMYQDYVDEFLKNKSVRFLEPMSAFEDVEYLDRDELIGHEIAELKYDGHRGTLFIGEKYNRNFSRNVVKKSGGWLGEGTDQVPHIRDLILPGFEGTVIDGEFDYGTNSNAVQSVMGSKPENAIQYQIENGFIKYFAFDILYYKGVNVQAMPLWKRKVYLMKVILAFKDKYANCNVEFAKIYAHSKAAMKLGKMWNDYCDDFYMEEVLSEYVEIVESYAGKYYEVVDKEMEGIVVKDIQARYEQKRTKSFIKIKDTGTWDCVMMGITEPTKEYEGKELDTWEYWETPEGKLTLNDVGDIGSSLVSKGFIPVTKPYYMGWCGAIRFGVWKEVTYDEMIEQYGVQGYELMLDNGELDPIGEFGGEIRFRMLVQVGDCKGLTEKIQIDLKENWLSYLQEERVVEVKANGILDKEKGSLRHPRFYKWRDDKSSNMCDFDSHVRRMKK